MLLLTRLFHNFSPPCVLVFVIREFFFFFFFLYLVFFSFLCLHLRLPLLLLLLLLLLLPPPPPSSSSSVKCILFSPFLFSIFTSAPRFSSSMVHFLSLNSLLWLHLCRSSFFFPIPFRHCNGTTTFQTTLTTLFFFSLSLSLSLSLAALHTPPSMYTVTYTINTSTGDTVTSVLTLQQHWSILMQLTLPSFHFLLATWTFLYCIFGFVLLARVIYNSKQYRGGNSAWKSYDTSSRKPRQSYTSAYGYWEYKRRKKRVNVERKGRLDVVYGCMEDALVCLARQS